MNKKLTIQSLAVFMALLSSFFPCESTMAEEKQKVPESENILSSQLKGLSSPDGEVVASSIRDLSSMGKKVVPVLVSAARSKDSKLRTNIIRTLAGIQGDLAAKSMARIACEEKNPLARLVIANVIKSERPEIARSCFLPDSINASNNLERRAASADYMRLLRDKDCVDELLGILESNPALLKTKRNVSLDINLEEKTLDGWSDYSTTVPLTGGKGGNNTVTNPIRMPIIGVKSINTRVVIAALSSLEIVTGQNFGSDISQWRQWWNMNRNSFSEE